MGMSATQLSARLKLAQMWNHNGTNMDGIGFMYRSYRVLMELQGDTPHGMRALHTKSFLSVRLHVASLSVVGAVQLLSPQGVRGACLLLWQETSA